MKKALKIGCLSLMGIFAFIIIVSVFALSGDDNPEEKIEVNTKDISDYYQESVSYLKSENYIQANETLHKIIEMDSSYSKIDTIRDAITKQHSAVVEDLNDKLKYFKSISYKKEDEFQNRTFYLPKSERGTYGNTIYSYFSVTDNGTVSLPRIVIRYYGDDWIFWETVIFSIDGDTHQYTPTKRPDRDNSSGSVWEKVDFSLDTEMYNITQKFYDAEKVRYRLKGDYVKDLTLSKKKIKTLKDMIDYCYFLQNQDKILNFKVN